MGRQPQRRKHRARISAVFSLVLLLSLALSACGADTATQQRTQQSKKDLDATISHAQSIGVPAALLQPVLNQETSLANTSEPFSLFSSQPSTSYYTNLDTRYRQLNTQVQGIESQSTQQLDSKAYQDIQTFEQVLAQRQSQGFVEAKTFADQLTQDQQLMAKAQFPKHYTQVSTNARQSIQALQLMGPAYDKLNMLNSAITQMKGSNLDVSPLQQQYNADLELFRGATDPSGFNKVIDLLNTQLSESNTLSAQSLPFIGTAKLNLLSNDIALIKQYGGDTSSYDKQITADKTALGNAKTVADFIKVSNQIDSDTAAIRVPVMAAQAKSLLKQYLQEVSSWGNSHQYHDPNDGNNYVLDYEYDETHGFADELDSAVNNAQTADDYQSAIDMINNDMTNLKAMEADYNDQTPWQQPHATDQQLMQYYKASGEVLVVSFVEQSLRVYQNGKLIKALHITTGQYDKPSPPGFWHIIDRESPTKFKSSEPKGSPLWYPDTKINFAMEFRDDGYYFHDSWWRLDYGPGTNFPHTDSGGDTVFAGSGSHGCVNVQEDDAKWLYTHSDYNTTAILY